MEDKECSSHYRIDMLFYKWRLMRDNVLIGEYPNLNEAKREYNRLRKKFCGYNSKYNVKHHDMYDEVR
jgi:hypothetical protein